MERIVKNVFKMIQIYNYLVYDKHLEFGKFSIKEISFEKDLVELYNKKPTIENIDDSIRKINLFNGKEKLKKRLMSYFEYASPENIYASYIVTVYNWIEKYNDADFVFRLSKLFNEIIRNIIKYLNELKIEDTFIEDIRIWVINDPILDITDYWSFVVAEYLKTNPKKDSLYYTSIGNFLFLKPFINKNSVLEYEKYISLVGENIYKKYLKDKFKNIKNDDFHKYLMFNLFVVACKYTDVFTLVELENYAQIFVNIDMFDKVIYQKLKEINSKYADKYIAKMVMNEVK
jgi:hypothetical protein